MKNKKKGLKILLVLLFSVFIINSVFAVWLNTLQTTGIYTLNSNGAEFGFTSFFSEVSIDSTRNESYTSIIPIDTAIINNPSEDKQVSVNIEIIKTDVADYCEDYLDDCTLNIKAKEPGYCFEEAGLEMCVIGETIDLIDGDSILLRNGNTKLQNYVVCQPNSCPQEISVIVKLIQD